MSLPVFPNTDITIDDSISQILSSVAMEELALSHIMNAEGEKLQFFLRTLPGTEGESLPSLDEVLEANESVRDTLSAVSINQMFLFAKASSALRAYFKNKEESETDENGNGGGDGNGGGTEEVSVVIESTVPPLNDVIYLGLTQSTVLTATVTGTTNHEVTWEYTINPTGQLAPYTVNESGNTLTVTATAFAVHNPTLVIKAVSAADPTKSDSVVISFRVA
jgi:hypothetical protein